MGRRRKRSCVSTIFKTIGILCLVVVSAAAVWFGINRLQHREDSRAEQIPFPKTNVTEGELSQKYYYGQLKEGEQRVYEEILQGVKENMADIYIHIQDADRANTIFQYVLNDMPEVFWCDGTVKSTVYEGERGYTVLQPVYIYEGEEKEARKASIETAVQESLAGVSAEASDYEKLLYVYEYIVNTVDYDLNAPDNQNIYSVFVDKKSVCAGYSKATQYLLERLGVFATYATGKTASGQNHAWNLVQCSGDYYYMDTTWGDPVFQASEESQSAEEVPNISYDYLCCDDEELFKTHVPDAGVTFPACTKMDWNYYVVNGMYYTKYDGDEALKAMNEAISAKGTSSVFKYANHELYEQARADIFDNQTERAAQSLAEWYGLSEVKYQYMDEEELNKITIYWQYE